jgi:membrane fusion protein, multidrug efflux system
MFKPQILMDRLDRLERRELRQASAAELGLSGESPSRSSLLGAVMASRREPTERLKAASAFAWLGLALLVSGAALAGETSPPPPEIRLVRTVVATARAEGEPVSLTGHIRARTEESLAFRIDGRVIARRIDVGQIVKPGDLVAELDPQPQQDALRAAQAQHSAALASLHEAANNMERQRVLVAQGWSTRVQFDATQRTFLSAKADVDATAAKVHSAEDQLGYTKLLVDSSGPVIATGAETGEVVKVGQMIVTIALDDGADAVFDVPASLMRQVSPDAEITLALTDDPTIRTVGRVRETAPQADPVTRSYRVKVGLTDRPEAMRLGATVTGQTHMVASGGIELPATALTMVDNEPAVWVVDPQSHQVSLRPVQLHRQDSGGIVVAHGLKGGERVVTAGVHALRPGQKVRLLEASQ